MKRNLRFYPKKLLIKKESLFEFGLTKRLQNVKTAGVDFILFWVCLVREDEFTLLSLKTYDLLSERAGTVSSI